MSASGWLVGALLFGVVWLANLVGSRTHLKVKLDETRLTIKRVGEKGGRFDLIGLKTKDEPIDYLESFLLVIGSLSLKTHMNKPIFSMKRMVGLYRIPLFPFRQGTLKRIEEMFSYQGKVLSVDPKERAELAELAEMADEDDRSIVEDANEIDRLPSTAAADIEAPNSPDIQ